MSIKHKTAVGRISCLLCLLLIPFTASFAQAGEVNGETILKEALEKALTYKDFSAKLFGKSLLNIGRLSKDKEMWATLSGVIKLKIPEFSYMEMEVKEPIKGGFKTNKLKTITNEKIIWSEIMTPSSSQLVVIKMLKETNASKAISGNNAAAKNGPIQQLKLLIEKYDSKYIKNDRFKGVPVRIIECTPKPQNKEQPRGNTPLPTLQKSRLWIGTSDGIIHKTQLFDEKDKMILEIYYKDVEVNKGLPDSLFEYTPPPGAQVMDMTVPGSRPMFPETDE